MQDEQETINELRKQTKLLGIVATKGLRQHEAIHVLSEAGFSASDIASLIGTTPNTVSVTLHRKRMNK